MSKNKKSGGTDKKSVPPLKIEIVKDNTGSDKEESLGDRDPLSGIDDINIDSNRRKKQDKKK